MYKVGVAYKKPLMPTGAEMMLNPVKVMRRLGRLVLKRIRTHMLTAGISPRLRAALNRALTYRMRPSSLVIEANHPAARFLIEGQRRGPMSWLLKAKAPIPILLPSGELIFRKATARSLADGKWVHPGRQPLDFLERAKQEARKYLKTEIAKELRRAIRASIG